MNKKKSIILITILIILLAGIGVFYIWQMNGNTQYLPEKYDQYKIGKSTLYFEDGKISASDIIVKLEEKGANLIFKNNKLTVEESSGGEVTNIDGAMLKVFVDTIINDFRNIAGFEAYKADIISDSRFLKTIKIGTEVLLYSANNKTFQLGTYDGIIGLGVAIVIDKEISETITIIIKE